MITSVANSPNFKGVYFTQDNFTIRQGKVAKNIVEQLMLNDYSEPQKTSYLDRYEKNNIDFVIKPASDEWSVDLYACKKLSKNGYKNGDNIKLFGSEDKKCVGTYSAAKPFKLEYIKNIDVKPPIPPQLKLFGMLILAAGVVFMPLITQVRKSISPHYMNDNYLKADTLTNAVDTIAKDTAKFVSKLK